jgi:hypothetical protein
MKISKFTHVIDRYIEAFRPLTLSMRHQDNHTLLSACTLHANMTTFKHTHKHDTSFCKYDDDNDGEGTMRANSSMLPLNELKHHFGF